MEPRTVSGAANPIRQSWPESFWGEDLRQNFPRLGVKSGGESEFQGNFSKFRGLSLENFKNFHFFTKKIHFELTVVDFLRIFFRLGVKPYGESEFQGIFSKFRGLGLENF